MQFEHSVTAHWSGAFDGAAIRSWAVQLRRQLAAPRVSLGLIFVSPTLFDQVPALLEILRVHAEIPLLLGCSSEGLIVGTQEKEGDEGFVLGLHHLPGAKLQAVRFTQEQVEESNGPGYWHLESDINPGQTNGWLVFANPFHLEAEGWLRGWNEAYPGKPVLGGLASGDSSDHVTQVYLDGGVFEEGGVALSVGGEVELTSVIAQGCTPIGETWTVTKADRNLVHQVGNRPAYEVLAETFQGLSPTDQQKAHGNLFIGLVINEYLEDFHRGDFLVRNILGRDPRTGGLAVGASPRTGQTMQFQRRDAGAADEDLKALLTRVKEELAGRIIFGGCLCVCNGRGHRLFGHPHHDAGLVQEYLGPLGLTGFFGNGEIGPVGGRNFLHGYTASLAMFTNKVARPA